MKGTHVPVLAKEVIDALCIQPGKKYIDATVGGGGHGIEIVRKNGILLGIDQDKEALDIARENIEREITLVHANFSDIGNIAEKNGFEHVDGILFDLGVSSMQLDTPERGFSYRFTDAPLDLRMDKGHGDTAAQLVNQRSEEELYEIVSTYGEEQLARSVANAICSSRRVRPIQTVGNLVDILCTLVPNQEHRFGVLSRVFQGLRIEVNDELGSLKKGLEGARKLLVPKGRLAVISFHSLEDRIVKLFMKSHDDLYVVTKHPIRPTEDEKEQNKRSRSAKLRIAQKKDI